MYDKHSIRGAMNMNRSITAKAQEINGHAMFFNIGRIFNAFFLCNSMNKDTILSEFNRNFEQLAFSLLDMQQKIDLVPHDSRQIKGCVSGLFERFTVKGESVSKKSGAIFFFDDGGYWAMNHKTGETCNGSPKHQGHIANQNYKREPAPCKEIAKQDMLEMGRKIAKKILISALPATQTPYGIHDYIDKKEISHHGLLICDDADYYFRKGWLLIPLLDEKGLCNLQFISPSGDKRFITGAKKKGAFGCWGLYKKGNPILLTEGAATARTLYDTLVMPVFFGIDAGNLTHALRAIINKYEIDTRVTKITIAADYDLNGVGGQHAAKALLDNFIEVDERTLVIPNFNVSTDWNDVLTRYKNGKEAITQIFANLQQSTRTV